MATRSIRNIVLAGHSGNGKTSLAEAMLYRAGVIDRPGRVPDGSTVFDYDPIEHRRHQSLSLSTASFTWADHKINVIDTPGYADFVGEVTGGMDAADLAVFVIDGVSGVQAQDVVLWRLAERAGLPRVVFVNALDRDNSSFERTLEDLRTHFGSGVAPAELPIGSESEFSGIADLVTDRALEYSTGRSRKGPIPEDLVSAAQAGHEQLVEDVVEGDDELLEQYLEGIEPTAEQLERLLNASVGAGTVFPVLCGSATTPIGVDRLLDFICRVGPAPGELGPAPGTAGDQPVEIDFDPNGRPVVFVFKTKIDEFLGQISYLKVVSGRIRSNDTLVDARTGDKERFHHLVSLTGAAHTPVDAISAGDIAAVTKLDGIRTGDTLSDDASLTVRVASPPTRCTGWPSRRLPRPRRTSWPLFCAGS